MRGHIDMDRATLTAIAGKYSAMAEIDERAEFEQAQCDGVDGLTPEHYWFERDREGDYTDPRMQSAWGGWQDRAALERKP